MTARRLPASPSARPARGAGGRGLGGGLSRTAGLRPCFRIAQTLHVAAADQVLTTRTERLQMAMLDPATDRHVAHAELGCGGLYGQQLVLFHATDGIASREEDNTLRGCTGIFETCILH